MTFNRLFSALTLAILFAAAPAIQADTLPATGDVADDIGGAPLRTFCVELPQMRADANTVGFNDLWKTRAGEEAFQLVVNEIASSTMIVVMKDLTIGDKPLNDVTFEGNLALVSLNSNSIAVIDTAPVPPAVVLAGMGLISFAGYGLRRRRKR